MSDPIEIPLDDADRLADPPLLDLFHEEADRYVATFIPSDVVSAEPTLTVQVNKQSVEGRRTAILLARMETICGARIVLASHLGGGNYTLRLANDQVVTLDAFGKQDAVELFDRLKQIAVDADMFHRINYAHAHEWRPAV